MVGIGLNSSSMESGSPKVLAFLLLCTCTSEPSAFLANWIGILCPCQTTCGTRTSSSALWATIRAAGACTACKSIDGSLPMSLLTRPGFAPLSATLAGLAVAVPTLGATASNSAAVAPLPSLSFPQSKPITAMRSRTAMRMKAPLNASARLARVTQSQGDETLRNAGIARERDAKRAMRPMISTWSAKPLAHTWKGGAPH